MINTFSFQFDDLVLNISEINRVLGYEGQELPEPFPAYLEKAMDDCRSLKGISGSYYIAEQCSIDNSAKIIRSNDIDFKVGHTILNALKYSTKFAFFICTAGEKISKKSEALLKGEDPVLGYIYDVLGTLIAESVADKIQNKIKYETGQRGELITNRYSPGYCQWHVSDQPKLFSLFNGSTSGVSLTPSCLMTPVKSISGVIGIGKKVIFRDYQCSNCNSQRCIYRKMH